MQPPVSAEPVRNQDPIERKLGGDLRELLGLLRRGWRIVAISVLVCLTLAAIYLAAAERLYQANAQVLVLQHGGRPLSVSSSNPTGVVDRDDDLMATHALVVASPLILGRAIDSVGLRNLPTVVASGDPVKAAAGLLRITRPDRTAKILQISYRASSRGEAVRMVEAITRSFEQFLSDSYQKNNLQAVSLISKARDELTLDIDKLQREYLKFQQENEILTADESGRSFIDRRLDQWDRASGEAMIKATRLRFQLDLVRKLDNDGVGLMATVYAMQQLGDDFNSLASFASSSASTLGISSDFLRQLVQQQQQLAEKYGPQYSKVKELQEQIDRVRESSGATRSRLDKTEIDGMIKASEQSLAQIEQMRQEFKAQFAEDLAQAKKSEGDRLKAAALRTNLERHQALFNTIVDQLKQAQFNSDFSSVSAQTIEPANADPAPVQPRLTLTLALALMVGALAGCGLVVLGDRLDQRIRSIDELRAALDLPILGEVPEATAEQLQKVGQFGTVVHTRPRSAWAEAYRATRTNIDFLRRSRRLQVLMVTSPNPGDGKSTTASNLAISIAHAGRRVLLIDGDLRRPTQHTLHGLLVEDGLTDALRSDVAAAEFTKPAAVEHLDLMTAGPEAPHPAELLTSERFSRLIEGLRETYDTIIIDSSPLLAVADPAIIAARVDGVVLVAPPTSLTRHEARRVMEVFDNTGIPVVGVVANAVRPMDYGYGHGYGYGRAYGRGGSPDPDDDGAAHVAGEDVVNRPETPERNGSGRGPESNAYPSRL
jgi:capsular exopolysaccharide synthesis family protein